MLGPLMFFTSVSIDSILRNMWSFDVIRDGAIEIIEKLTWQNQLNQLNQLAMISSKRPPFQNLSMSRFRGSDFTGPV